MTSGSVSSSATGDNAGALDGVGRADEILRAEVDDAGIEVDDIGVELTTGTVLEDDWEDDCVPTFWCFFQRSPF